ncbi:MmgE/PrpD family protein [Actibacterium lipolyticum]|uniref:2-methylcitrate dehydratase n=1 Tax=Actibacterium lipolyticum TaxID=1524263 RepID=A0A238JYF1_9RHOB|nr:MmgE/PrpD family protein [Actibacterium lipolyticum]SMX35144.1 2-methylcitrate dehydratase [Actibacterium lipolyticum]
MGQNGITEAISSFAINATPADSARAMMRLSLLDWAACGIAGQQEPVARLTRALGLEDGGTGEASVFGTATRLPARAAALINGATSHALDYDDTHFAHIGHPSVAVIPAALAVAEGTGAKGDAFLDAVLVGVEVSVRVGTWLGRAHYQAGFHQTATAGAFGATVAACRLLGCDAAQTAHAVGLTATRASGLKSQFGTMGKPYNAGIAASNGVEAALLAARGFIANPVGLEGAQGFGPTHCGEAVEAALDGLGAEWLFEGISHKFHACCHGTHAMLEAIGALDQTDPDNIARVTVTTHPRWLTVCNLSAPQTGLEAKFSYRLTAAMALSGYDTGALSSFSDALCVDPKLTALRDKVVVLTDETLAETATRVVVERGDGTSVSARFDLDTPIALDVRRGKLRAKAISLLGADREGRLWGAVSNTTGPDLAALCALVQGQ